MNYYSTSTAPKYFWIWGHKFSQALMYTFSTSELVATTYYDLSGIKRPTNLAYWTVANPTQATDAFNIANQIGIFAADAAFDKQDLLSNVTVTANTSEFNFSFANTDGNTSLATNGGTSTTTIDSGTNYKSDAAGNVKLTIGFPTAVGAVPRYSYLFITSTTIFPATTVICGIQNSTFASDCVKSGNRMRCTIPATTSSTISICCYNVTMVVNPQIDSFAIAFDKTINVMNTSSASSSDDIVTLTQVGTYTFANDNAPDSAVLEASLGTVTYDPSTTEGGLGAVVFSVNLPRDPVRDGKIVFEGVFSAFVTTATPLANIRCMPSFSSTGFGAWEKGDVLIDSCNISGIGGTSDSIVVVTKNIIYKCGLSFDKVLYITLSPVTLGKLLPASPYRVLMKGPGGVDAANNLIKPANDLTYSPSSSILGFKPLDAFISNILCPLSYTGVYPRLPGAIVDYTFDFDLTTYQVNLDTYTTVVNEFTIFWDTTIFGDYLNSNSENQLCTVLKKRVNCVFSRPGILNIRLNSNASTTSNVSITVLNVLTPAFDTDLSFYCTVNNLTGDVRTNLLTGSGLMAQATDVATGMRGVIQKAITSKTFNLIFFPVQKVGDNMTVFFTSKSGPNESSDITLTFGVDYHGEHLTPPGALTIAGISTFHFFFPSDYPFSSYQLAINGSTSFEPAVTIIETYTGKVNASAPISLETATVSGNRVSVSTTAALVVNEFHKYWTVKISKIRNPALKLDATRINVAIVNSNYEYLFRSWDNTHNQVNTVNPPSTDLVAYPNYPIPTTASMVPANSFIVVTGRGFKYGETNKWDSIFGTNNTVELNAGRFSKITLNLQKNTDLALTKALLNTITLPTSIFMLVSGSTFTLVTTVLKVDFKLGTPCATVPGNFFLQFTQENNTDFYPLPVLVIKLGSAPGVITFNFDGGASSTIQGGVLPGAYTIQDEGCNVDVITGSWVASTTSTPTNDTKASVTFPSIGKCTLSTRAQFFIETATVTNNQNFVAGSLSNTCFNLNKTTLTVSLTPNVGGITATTNIGTWFVYKDPATDTVLTGSSPTRLNGLRWVVTPTFALLNIYCALVCKNAAVPSDASLIGQTVVTGPLYQYYSSYYPTANSATDMIFAGLVRGQDYALTCVSETTEFDQLTRKRNNYTSMGDTNGDLTVTYTPQDVEKTVCLTFTFNVAAPTQAIKNAILGFCQNTFSAGAQNAILTGCIVCVDSDNKTVDGQSLPVNVTCPAARRRLRSLTTSTRILTDAEQVADTVETFVYNICAVQSVTCNSNVPASRRLRDLQNSGVFRVITGTVQEGLKDAETMAATLKVPVTSITLASVGVVQDTVAPVIAVTLGTASNDNSGNFSAVVLFDQTSSYDCYYQVISGTTKPSAVNIKGCTNTSTCGMVVLKSPSVTVTNTVSPAFTVGSSYTVWAVCYNQVPGAQLASNVFSVYVFTPVCPTGQTVANGVCTTPQPPTPVTPTPTPSSKGYVFMSIAFMIATLFILFN
jgi:hypothetical protein